MGKRRRSSSSRQRTERPQKIKVSDDKVIIFQDVMSKVPPDNQSNEEGVSIADSFFDLANAPTVGYRVSADQVVKIRQDITACGNHTGGIVWETSYLLLEFLRHHCGGDALLGRTVEIGAGCGLLGIGVKLVFPGCRSMVLTETKEVLVNLKANLELNKGLFVADGHDEPSANASLHQIRASALDWTHLKEDAEKAEIEPKSVDTVVGTDILFNPDLVRPLWETLCFVSHADTTIWLCVQKRCERSHELFLELASHYGFTVSSLQDELASIPSLAWGVELECQLFKICRCTANCDD